MSKLWSLIVVLYFGVVYGACAQSPAPHSFSVTREDGSSIHYYVQRKNTETAARNLVVILQGSDCNSVRHITGIHLLKNIYPDGDLLTVEKYGITEDFPYSDDAERPDCPKAYITHDSPDQRVSDLERVLTSVRETHEYDKVIVIGGSEGAVVAAMLTAKVNYVDATVMFGGGGRFFLDDVLHSITVTTSSEEEMTRSIEGFTQFAKDIRSSEPFDMEMSNHGYAWWHAMLSLDQEAFLSQINTPVLILQGGQDRSASPEKAAEMVESLKEQGKQNIEYSLYPEYTHSLGLSEGDGFAEDIMTDVTQWLSQHIVLQ